MPVPEWYPGLRSILVGQDGSLWLERWTVGPDRTWEVRDASGNLQGLLTIPLRVRIRVATAQQVWATDRTPDDLDDIVHYRLTAKGN
jgi:hypothetical protein